MDFVYTAKMKKKHRCVINNKTANHVSSQGANPKNAMKRERFGCVSVHKNLARQSPIRILKCFNFKFKVFVLYNIKNCSYFQSNQTRNFWHDNKLDLSSLQYFPLRYYERLKIFTDEKYFKIYFSKSLH